MNRIFPISLILLFCFGGFASAQDDGWRVDKEKNGIQISTRATEGSDFREIRATTHIQGRLSSIVALLQDMSYWPKLNTVFSSARIYKQISETESLVYFEMDMPWPVSDRDVLNYRHVQQDEHSKVVTLATMATSDVMPEREDYVRIIKSTQRWTLTPNPKGGVDVHWITHTDPNGPLPAPVVNFLSVGAPYDSLSILRAAIESGEYGDAQLPYIQEP